MPKEYLIIGNKPSPVVQQKRQENTFADMVHAVQNNQQAREFRNTTITLLCFVTGVVAALVLI